MNVTETTTTKSIVLDRIERKLGDYYELYFHCGDFKLEVEWNPTLEEQERFTGNIRTPEGAVIDGFGGFSVTFPYFGGLYLNKKFENFSAAEKEVITFLFPLKQDRECFQDFAGNIYFDILNENLKKGELFNRPSKDFVDLVRQYLPVINRELAAVILLGKRFDTVQKREEDVLFLRMAITYWSKELASAFDSDDLAATVIPASQITEYKQSFKIVTGRDWSEKDKLTEEEVEAILAS